MTTRIGSFFEFPAFEGRTPENPAFSVLQAMAGNERRAVFVGDGRQAVRAALLAWGGDLRGRICRLPAYLCRSLLQPFAEMGLRVEFYSHTPPLAPQLNPAWRDDLVVLCDTFGAPCCSDEEVRALLAAGCRVLLDASHSLFSTQRLTLSHPHLVTTASLRKMLPIPDGGVVYLPASMLESMEHEPAADFLPMLEAMILMKYTYTGTAGFLGNGGKTLLRLYQEFETGKDNRPVVVRQMPDVSRLVLEKLDFPVVCRRRMNNLACLAELLPAAMHLLPPDRIQSPFYFPLLCADQTERDLLLERLAKKDIFPHVHWPLPGAVGDEFAWEHELAGRVLSLPVDQRYDEGDMRLLAEQVLAGLQA